MREPLSGSHRQSTPSFAPEAIRGCMAGARPFTKPSALETPPPERGEHFQTSGPAVLCPHCRRARDRAPLSRPVSRRCFRHAGTKPVPSPSGRRQLGWEWRLEAPPLGRPVAPEKCPAVGTGPHDIAHHPVRAVEADGSPLLISGVAGNQMPPACVQNLSCGADLNAP